jgi:hypothetical protein
MRIPLVWTILLWTGLHAMAIGSPQLRAAITGDAAPFLGSLLGPWVAAGVLGALGLCALAAAPGLSARIATCLGTTWLLASLALAWGDVVLAAREARGVCAVGVGLKVHERIAVRGILGLSDIAHWHAAGFTLLERHLPDGRFERWTLRAAKPHREPVPVLASEAEYAHLPEQVLGRAGALRVAVVRARVDGRVLGEARELVLPLGWAERLLGLGLPRPPRLCRSPLPDPPGVRSFRLPDDLIEQTLIPAPHAPPR